MKTITILPLSFSSMELQTTQNLIFIVVVLYICPLALLFFWPSLLHNLLESAGHVRHHFSFGPLFLSIYYTYYIVILMQHRIVEWWGFDLDPLHLSREHLLMLLLLLLYSSFPLSQTHLRAKYLPLWAYMYISCHPIWFKRKVLASLVDSGGLVVETTQWH